MSVNYVVIRSSNAPSLNPIAQTITLACDEVNSISLSVPPSTTNQAFAISWGPSKLQGCWLGANIGTTTAGTLTLILNNTGSPAGTLSFYSNFPLDWDKFSGFFSNPFNSGGTVTIGYLTNAGSATVTLSGQIGINN